MKRKQKNWEPVWAQHKKKNLSVCACTVLGLPSLLARASCRSETTLSVQRAGARAPPHLVPAPLVARSQQVTAPLLRLLPLDLSLTRLPFLSVCLQEEPRLRPRASPDLAHLHWPVTSPEPLRRAARQARPVHSVRPPPAVPIAIGLHRRTGAPSTTPVPELLAAPAP